MPSTARTGTPTTAGVGRPGVGGAGVRAAGVGAPVLQATDLLSGVVATLDPGRLTGPDAADRYRMFAAVERLSMAGKTLLAPRIDESGVWRDGGHRSPAVMLGELEGVPTGQTRNTLEVGHRLPDLPGTEEALRSGTLSGPKVAELSGAAVLDPASEGRLLAGAGNEPLQKIKERCQRARASAERRDPLAAVRRIHAARHFSSWTDAEPSASRVAIRRTAGRKSSSSCGTRCPGCGRPLGPRAPGPNGRTTLSDPSRTGRCVRTHSSF